MEISSVLAFRDVGLLAVMIKYFSHRHRLQRLDLGEYGCACLFFAPCQGVGCFVVFQLPYEFTEFCLVTFGSMVETGFVGGISCFE